MKWVIGVFLFALSFVVFAEPTFVTKHAYVVNLDTGEVVLGKGQSEIVPIASITKLMTAYVIATSDLEMIEEIEITKADLDATRDARYSVGLFIGSKYTREELLLLALMSSSNRAAAALARTHPDGYEGFITLMNKKAFELGMYDTRYEEPTGLSYKNTSSAEDLVKLLQAAIDHPMIGRFSTETFYKKTYKIEQKVKTRVKTKKGSTTKWVTRTRSVDRYFGTTNRLLLTDDWNIYLQKTGFTRPAGYCVTMIVNIGGENYALILLNAPNQRQRAIDAIKAKYWVEYRVVPSNKIIRRLDPYKRR